jgi:ribosomal RNA-processing protein 36
LKQFKKSSKKKNVDDGEVEDDDDDMASKKRKRSKHAPAEVSSKRRAKVNVNSSGVGVEIGANRYQPQDPRMESMSGFYDPNVFEKRYAFLGDMEAKELKVLKERIAARSMNGKKGQKRRRKLGLTNLDTTLEEDKEELIRLKQLHQQRNMEQIQRAAKQAVKKKLRDDVAEGKRGAYYLKRSEQKRLEVEAKFEEIRKRGGKSAVNKALAKKRKKNLSKQSSLMPEK